MLGIALTLLTAGFFFSVRYEDAHTALQIRDE